MSITGGPDRQDGQRGSGQLREIGRLRTEEMGMAVPHPRHHHRDPVPFAPRIGWRFRLRAGVGDGVAVDHHASVRNRITSSRNQNGGLDPCRAGGHMALRSITSIR